MSFLGKSLEFIAVGDTAIDAFIRLKQADIVDNVDHTSRKLCVAFGGKVPYEFVKVIPGVGNSANAAVCAARLGLSSALVSDTGDDQNGKECRAALQKNKVSVKYVTSHKGMNTNYHYVLWYGDERTILVKHENYPHSLPHLKSAPKWLYLSSLGENSLEYHRQIFSYLNNNPEIKLAFQPGTYQIKFGLENLKDIYQRTNIFFCNTDEARKILNNQEQNVKKLLADLAALGPKISVITDGSNGAYAYDSTDYWFMPAYPDPKPPLQRTGAGDAFASTVTVALALGKSVEEALTWAPINAMSVVQEIGAQAGLLNQEKLLEYLVKAPADYRPRKI